MPEPKWVISMGACASVGGVFDNYAIVQGVDQVVPVDVFVPGCPPRPESLIYGIVQLQKKIDQHRSSSRPRSVQRSLTSLIRIHRRIVAGACPGSVEPRGCGDGMPTIDVPREHLRRRRARALRDRAGLSSCVAADVTAVDFIPREPRFDVDLLHLVSPHRRRAERCA